MMVCHWRPVCLWMRIDGKIIEDVIVLPRDGVRPDDEVYVIDDKGKADIRKVDVLDLSAERAVLWSGVKPGELVVLSPLEKSRTAFPLKALNVNDPSEVFVDPPAPDWATADDKEKDGAEKTKSEDKKASAQEDTTAK